MEEVTNLTQDDVLDLIMDFPVQPLKNKVIITLNTVPFDDGGVNLNDMSMDEVQFVVAKGSHVLDLEAGQKVILDLEKMMQFLPVEDNTHEKRGVIKIKPIDVNGRIFALISDNLIDAKDAR